jgi:alpha-L-arabinofuranosidase
MTDEQETVSKKKWRGLFRLWLLLASALFLVLLTLTQFLSGGPRTFSDWLPALFFLVAVTLAFATTLIGGWLILRPPYGRRKFKRLAFALAGIVILVVPNEFVKAWHALTSRPKVDIDSAVNGQSFEPHPPLMLASETNDVRVKIDASRVIRTVDTRLFGVNTAIWDSLLDTPETVSALRELDLQVLRFGGFSDTYHWADGTFGSNSGPAPISFFHFMRMATNLGAQTIITVNYGSGTPEEAAAWVRCANITNRCGFKYWEIGNENYGDWEHDENSPPHDPVTYAIRAKEYIRQMKAIDPSIKVGVVVTENWMERAEVPLNALKKCNLREFIVEGYQGWTPKMLATFRQLGVTPDWVSVHYYPQVMPGHENDARLLQSTAIWAALAAPLRQHLKNYFGEAHTNVEMLCTENNSVPQNTGKQTTSLVNGLYLADSFGQIAQTEFNSYVWWNLRNAQDRSSNNNPSLYGWRQYGDHGIMSGNDIRYPTFHVFKLLKYFARGGDQIVRATSDNKLLSVYAARRIDKTLALLVINKSPQTVMHVSFSITSFQPQPEATIYSYGIPQDQAARTGAGSEDIVQSTSTGASTEFACTFQPYSATVMLLSPIPAN